MIIERFGEINVLLPLVVDRQSSDGDVGKVRVKLPNHSTETVAQFAEMDTAIRGIQVKLERKTSINCSTRFRDR